MDEDPFTTRVARPRDAAGCVPLEHGHDESKIARWCEDGTVFVLAEQDRIAGYLRLEYLWGHLPYIALIRLEEGIRGRGHGTRLLQFVEDRLRDAGHAALLSSSEVMESRPQAWHRKVGFEEIGILAGVNPAGVGEVFFKKALRT